MGKKSKKGEVTVVDTSMFSSAEDVIKEEKTSVLVPVSPAIDFRIGGGIPSGTLVLFRTLPKFGKTTIAMQIAANALEQGRYVIYADIERRLEGGKYFAIKNFDPKNKKFIIIRAKKGEKLLSGDEIYTNIKNMMMVPKYRNAVYIVDSLSKVIPRATLEDNEIRADRRDSTPKLNADFCKKAGNLCRISGSIVIGIQHFIHDPNAMGDPLKPDGGIKLEFESDLVFESRRKAVMWDGNPINIKEEEKLPGLLARLNIPVNKRLAPYISKDDPICVYTKFGEGIWWGREALDVLQKIGLCYTKGGGYYVFLREDGQEEKIRGAETAVQYIESNRPYYESVIKDYMVKTYGASYDYKAEEETDEENENED